MRSSSLSLSVADQLRTIMQDLTCILRGELEGMTERVQPRLIKVEHLWRRVCDDKLVVGALLKNISER